MELREAGIRTPILVLYPPPPGWACELARAGIAVAAGEWEPSPTLIDELAAAGPNQQPLSIELEIETGLGRGGFVADRDLVAAAALVARSAGVRLAGLWTHFQAVEDAGVTTGPAGSLRSRRRSGRGGRDPALPPRHAAASAALIAAGVVSYDGVRPGLALYGIVPDELGPTRSAGTRRNRRRRRFCRSWRSTPARSASRSSPRAGASATDRPSGRRGPAGSPRCPSATATAGRERSRTGRRRSSVARCVPLVGNVAMDAVMADVTDVPGRPVDHTDEFVLMGQDGGERITALDLAQARTTNTWEVLTGMARRLPRVYHAAAGPVGSADPYRGEGLGWRPSSSGTATSAIWRSTRS